MKVVITCRNFEATDSITAVINKKVAHFSKYDHQDMRVEWICSTEKSAHKSEVNIKSNKGSFHASAESPDLYKTFDEVLPKIEKQLSKMKKDRMHQKSFE